MRVTVALLSFEHGVIRQVIDVLGEVIKRQATGKHRDQVVQIVEFLDKYMDRFHHKKEERFIFPFASEADGTLETEVKRLLSDHRKARRIIGSLQLEVERTAFNEPVFDKQALLLVKHVQTHVQHEENSVFPRIEELLSLEQDEAIYRKFEEFTLKKFGPDFHRQNEDFSFKVQEDLLGPGYYEGIV